MLRFGIDTHTHTHTAWCKKKMDDQGEPASQMMSAGGGGFGQASGSETVLETVQKWAEHFHSFKSCPERSVAITEHLQQNKRQSLSCSEQVLKKILSLFADKAGVESLSTLQRIQYLKVISEFEIELDQKILEQIAFGILISQSKPLMLGMEFNSVDRLETIVGVLHQLLAG